MTRGLVALTLVLAIAEVARAQDGPAPETPAAPETPQALAREATEHLARGTALFDRGHYDAALTEFLAGYAAMEGHPLRHQVLYNIAFSYERSFRYDEAILYYERYLSEGGGEDDRATEVRSVLASLEQLLGRIRIETALPQVEVWVDQHRVGEGGAPIRLPAGTHSIEVRAERHLPARREARVLAGRELRLTIELEPIGAFRGLPPAAFGVSASVTLAALGAGIGVGLASLLEGQTVRARLDGPAAWRVTAEEIAAVEELSLVADLLFGGAALGAIVSVVLLALTDWRGDEALSVGPGGLLARF